MLLPASAGAATIPVDTTADEWNFPVPGTGCALREAVQAARDNAAFGDCPAGQAAPAVDTITLDDGSFDLTRPNGLGADDENLNVLGDLDVGGGPVVIQGLFPPSTIIAQNHPDRIFDLDPGASLTLRDLRVHSGDVAVGDDQNATRGGNIRMRDGGTLVLEGVQVSNGQASVGGGIYATGDEGSLTIRDSRLYENVARAFGGGLDVAGGIDTLLLDTLVYDNAAEGESAANLGGGISTRTSFGVPTRIVGSWVFDNLAHATHPTGASRGGGIRGSGPLVVRRTNVSGNVSDAVTAANEQQGGGIYILGTAKIVNSTIYGNVAGPDSGDEGYGGGVFAQSGSLDIDHVTFASNDADENGDSIATGDAGSSTGAGIQLGASIIPGTLLTGDPCYEHADMPITSTGFNVAVADDFGCGYIAGDTTGEALGLRTAEPENNGGNTLTIALEPDSPAVNHVPVAACGPAEGTDQRGFVRPFGPACDAGAYELTVCQGEPLDEPGADGCCRGRAPSTFFATNGPDVLTGTPEIDVIVGLGGNDVIKGLGAGDIVCAGKGKDRVVGGPGRDLLGGEDGADTLRGSTGNDKLKGGRGNDKLRGGPGRDVLRGGPGRDDERQ